MKVTGYRQLTTVRNWRRPVGDVNGVIASGVTDVPIVILETDEGIEGVGMGSHAAIDQLFPALEGQDPRGVTGLYDAMLARVFKAGHGGSTFAGVATLDMALWDIKAKAAGEPLWRLLGAQDHWVPAYASGLDYGLDDEALHAFYSSYASRGFTAGKLKGGSSSVDDLRRLEVIRDALRPATADPALMLDVNESWNLKEAVRYMHRIESQVDLTWIEEPLRRWDAAGHAKLSASVRAAVATGENLSGLDQYLPLFDHGSADIVQAGAVWGVTHFMRVALAAHSRGLPISPVGLTALTAVGHAAAAVPNHMSSELQSLDHPAGVAIDEEYVDGGIVLGTEPGAGVTVDEVAITDLSASEASWLAEGSPHIRDVRLTRRLPGAV